MGELLSEPGPLDRAARNVVHFRAANALAFTDILPDVKVIGHRTVETVPGLKRHRRKALSAALSRKGLPVLFAIETALTFPVAEFTVIATIPSTMIFCRLAS